MAKKKVEFKFCETCKLKFRVKRTGQRYCSRKCNEKARRERAACRRACISPVPSHPPSKTEAKNGVEPPKSATQTDKKCLHTEAGSKRFESLLVRGPIGRKWGLNPKKITAEMLEAEGIKKAPLLSVMRAMCLDCRPPKEVDVCARPYCPLWPYRDGTSPWKRGI